MLVFAGLLFIAVGGYGFFRQRRFFKCAIMVHGIVVEWSRCGGKALWAPVAEFEFDGKIRRVSGTFYSSRPTKIGTRIWVGVNPENIQETRVKQNGEMFLYAASMLSGAFIIFFSIPFAVIEL